jgi:hypothetical protein
MTVWRELFKQRMCVIGNETVLFIAIVQEASGCSGVSTF